MLTWRLFRVQYLAQGHLDNGQSEPEIKPLAFWALSDSLCRRQSSDWTELSRRNCRWRLILGHSTCWKRNVVTPVVIGKSCFEEHPYIIFLKLKQHGWVVKDKVDCPGLCSFILIIQRCCRTILYTTLYVPVCIYLYTVCTVVIWLDCADKLAR